MTKIYNFQEVCKKKEDQNRIAYGYSKNFGTLMKDQGYNVNDPKDIDNFFEDLEEE
jgi:hypothetical protein